MISSVAAYSAFSRDLAQSTARVARQPQVQRATAAFESATARVQEVDDFVDNPAIYGYALKAFGLEEMGNVKGLIRRVLTEGVASTDSLANRLADSRYRDLAAAFSFDEDGQATFDDDALAGVEADYLQLAVERSAGKVSAGARLALYFDRKAADIQSPYSILADPALFQVVRTALSLPDTMAVLPIAAQARMIEKRVDIADFQDPIKRTRFLKGFAALYDAAQQQTDAAASPLLSLLKG